MGALIIYDITSQYSFDKLDYYFDYFRNNNFGYVDEDYPIILVGTRKDLEGKRIISYEKGLTIAKSYNVPFFEASSKTGENVEKIFLTLAQKCINFHEDAIKLKLKKIYGIDKFNPKSLNKYINL